MDTVEVGITIITIIMDRLAHLARGMVLVEDLFLDSSLEELLAIQLEVRGITLHIHPHIHHTTRRIIRIKYSAHAPIGACAFLK